MNTDMTIEDAKQIVKDMLSVALATHGIGEREHIKNIGDYTLREMLDANEMLKGYSEDGEEPGHKKTFTIIDDRGIASLYTWAHFPAEMDESSCQPLVHANHRALVLVQVNKMDGFDEEDDGESDK